MSRFIGLALTLVLLGAASGAMAQESFACSSHDYQYNQCFVGDMYRPQLVEQTSNSACIPGRTWGYNPRGGFVWVDNGCAGRFADAGGYRRGDAYYGTPQYRGGGGDDGKAAAVGALILGGIIGAAAANSDHGERHHQRSRDQGYDGCHGAGCLVDNPEDPNNWPLCSDGARHPDCSMAPRGY